MIEYYKTFWSANPPKALRNFVSAVNERVHEILQNESGSTRSHSSKLSTKVQVGVAVKILYLTSMPMTAMRFIFPLANRLRERGNIVEFAFGDGDGLKEVEESGFKFAILLMKNKHGLIDAVRIVDQLKKIIINGQYDVVHTYTPLMGLYGRLAAYKAKTPIVIHSVIGSLMAPGVPILHRLFYIVSEFLTSWMVDFFITLTEADTHTIVKFRFAPKENVGLLEHEYGIDLKRFNPDNIDKIHFERVRKSHRFYDSVPIIGFVGRMTGAKGILDLFEAYRLIRAKGIRAKLVFLGDILSSDKDRKSYAMLKDRVRESGFEDDVIFWGWHEDTPFYLSLMDVVVLPSHFEGFPRIPVEAGAMEKPSICTATSGAKIAIEEGKTGFIVPIRDPQSLAEAIQKIITNSDLARKMGSAARRRIVNLFDENKIVDQQVRIYQEFFKKKRETVPYSI